MIPPPEPTASDRRDDRKPTSRIGLRIAAVIILVIFVLAGAVGIENRRAADRSRALAELESINVGPTQYKPTVIGMFLGVLPRKMVDQIVDSLDDPYHPLIARPTEVSLLFVQPDQLDFALDRLQLLGGIRTLKLPSGLSNDEMGRVGAAMPEAGINLDPRFKYGTLEIQVSRPH